MSYDEMSRKLAGPIGLMKQFVHLPQLSGKKCRRIGHDDFLLRFISKNGRETAEDATQIFGGRAITTTGMGKIIENVGSPL